MTRFFYHDKIVLDDETTIADIEEMLTQLRGLGRAEYSYPRIIEFIFDAPDLWDLHEIVYDAADVIHAHYIVNKNLITDIEPMMGH